MHDSESEGRDSVEVGRRGFLGAAAMVVSGLVAVAGGLVALVYASAPALKKNGGTDAAWSAVPGKPETEPTRHAVTVVTDAGWAKSQATGAIFLDRDANGKVVAFSARCPHEGCQVEWSADASQFLCPCHASSWSREGNRLGGPTKRGLDPLEVRTTDAGGIEVKYVSYALDSAERIQVG